MKRRVALALAAVAGLSLLLRFASSADRVRTSVRNCDRISKPFAQSYDSRMRAVLLLLALAVASAVPVTSAATASRSGLRGLVTRGPTRPVCIAGMPCTAPAKGVLLTFKGAHATRSARTGIDGRYRVMLPPGRYTVAISPRTFGYTPRVAAVTAGRVAVRNFTIDTGIR